MHNYYDSIAQDDVYPEVDKIVAIRLPWEVTARVATKALCHGYDFDQMCETIIATVIEQDKQKRPAVVFAASRIY